MTVCEGSYQTKESSSSQRYMIGDLQFVVSPGPSGYAIATQLLLLFVADQTWSYTVKSLVLYPLIQTFSLRLNLLKMLMLTIYNFQYLF